MNCHYEKICGGCPLRNLSKQDYRQTKLNWFAKLLENINQQNIACDEPIFVADGLRRRAEFTFLFRKNHLDFGFNAAQSHNVVNIETCMAITPKLNALLLPLKQFLGDLCLIRTSKKVKNKIVTQNITQGEIWLTEADNGIDILLEIEETIALEHRLLISEFVMQNSSVIRFAVANKHNTPETVVEKNKPYINIADREVFISSGTFLQPSKSGEQALIKSVKQYMGNTTGKIADLFCGIGTFSYPLAADIKNKITAVDSSPSLLAGFRQSVNAAMIPNIEIVEKNLFKYPLDANELKSFVAVVFDPPRAGASAQAKQLSQMFEADKPQKVIAVSCNPHTFVNDANVLISGGYYLQNITLVDQFVYSTHYELVALFVKKGENDEYK